MGAAAARTATNPSPTLSLPQPKESEMASTVTKDAAARGGGDAPGTDTAAGFSAVGRSAGARGRLSVEDATLGYDRHMVSTGLTVRIPDESFTVIIGPNGCGKSTLLRALSRLLVPTSGAVLLDGKSIAAYKPKEVARRVGLLPQSSAAPDGISVADLVARGRFPHQSFLRQWTPADERAVTEAMAATGIADLAARQVGELSGGQQQRVWIAMALAQETPLLLLDEPTTFLDIAYQIDLMELLDELNRAGRTLVAVLHDLNQAARYATHLIAMRDGAVVAEGHPHDVVTAEFVAEVFGLRCHVIDDPVSGSPLVVPLDGRRP